MNKLQIARRLLVLLTFFISFSLQAQPKIILDFDLDYGWPLSSFKDWRPAIGYTTLDGSHGLKFGLGFSGHFKYAFNDSRSVRLVGGLTLNRFLNQNFSRIASTHTDNTDMYIFSPAVGIEYGLNPFGKLAPYAGIDLTGSYLSGGMSWSPYQVGTTSIDINPTWRLGLQLGVGANYNFTKKIALVVGLKYHMVNLIGKKADTTGFGQGTVNLNDDGYIYKNTNYGQTDINYVKIYLGIAFNFDYRKNTDKVTLEDDSQLPTDDALKAFAIAKRKFDKKEYVDAIEDLSLMKVRYSGSGIDDKIQYYIAESYILQKEYIFAEYEYKNFIKEFPQSVLFPDALYKLGLTYYYLSPKYTLDQDYSKQAISEFLEFIDAYPTDKNVADAEAKIKELRDKLAQKDYTIAVNYMKLGNNRSAALYFQNVYDNYIESQWADKAMLGHAEALINGNKFDDAEKILAKFYKLFPKSDQKTKAAQLEKRIKDFMK
jgi:outer membrane protein assembly factor BamD